MIEETINRWERCGIQSVDKLSLKQHYSVLFDDEEDGFQHLFSIPIETVKTLENHKYLETKIMELDEIMLTVNSYMENFFKNHLLKDMDGEMTIGELMDDYMEQIKEHYTDAMFVKSEINSYLESLDVK